MTFSYDPTLATDLDWIRLQIADTVVNNGPRIDNLNYSNEELSALLTRADDVKEVVVSQVFAILASEWTKLAVSYTIGPRKEELHRIAAAYEKKAEEWSIIAGTKHTVFSSGLYRAGSRENSELN
jgi:hypothetical protein